MSQNVTLSSKTLAAQSRRAGIEALARSHAISSLAESGQGMKLHRRTRVVSGQ
jgi:hypothetical protein